MKDANTNRSAVIPAVSEAESSGAARLIFRLYKALVSPVLHAMSPSRCIFLPTCSEYAYTAVSRFGMGRGLLLAARRFVRCHPWGRGGLDPVPECGGPGRAEEHGFAGEEHIS